MQLEANQATEARGAEHSSIYSRKNPYTAAVLMNRLLTGPASEKETRHIEVSLEGSGIQYTPGDSLGVLPENRSDMVQEVLQLLNFRGDEAVKDFYGGALQLREALTSWLVLGKMSHSTVKAWSKLADNVELAALVLPENKVQLESYLWGREFRDLLEQFPAKLEDPQQLFKILPRLAPRLYSISSSQALHPATVHMSVRIVRYESYGRERLGVCSGQLGERSPLGAALPTFIHSNQLFRLPENPDAPVIMVGPGTGLAPFRAFLEHKQAGLGRWPMWLFFGEQREQQDFLYREEMYAWLENGVMQRLDTAFSRDQQKKIYVQDRIREQSALLWEWLERGAYFYVCGDSKRMAPDVEAAVLEAIAQHSGKGPEYAAAFVADMRKQKRYLRDVY
ncbi:diflavin oxidoreductase [Terracidiphilus gabretensis]|uniref:diflavin oxidoreductase n=1 Tax=Terracidiphilus gabretensis TaxID=1577687 RepID=UPI00071C1DC4|nr:oxidoreductase [Terracidiphilus gabretensis]